MLGVRGFVFFALSVLSATGAFADPGKHVVLRSPQMGVLLSAGTGRVESIQDASGLVLLADNEDRYDLEGRPATEGQDQVVTARSDESTAQFDCRSAALGLNVRKVYRLRGSVLEKSATYTPEAGESRLLRIASRSRAAPALARDGCYYIPTDDGYKARALPFLPGPRITLPSPWTVSTGSFIYYLPKKGCVLTHYRYRINGEHFYGEADPEIESRFLPGGAITALGQAFVDRNTPLVLESRCALLQGDPRAWHRHIVGQPPYTAHRNDPVPAWFRKCRMFFGDGILGTGKGLVEEREAIGREVRSMLTFLREDESLMVFFNHWSTSGDYPSEGMVRPLDYRASQWGPPVPAARVRENIAWLKAISPRVKVGGYVFLGPAAGTEPYERHPEWFVYDRKGELRQGGDGVGPCAYPDFTTGYRDYSMNQMKRMVTDLGFDWIHMDCGPMEVVNWKARRAVQSSVSARFYEELAAYCAAHDKALVQNVAPLTVLWAHGGYFECQQPERWEKKDWRILGVHGHLDALARTLRPGVWTNLVYGTHREYGMRNAFSGMRGWIRSGLTWWRFIAHGFSYEDVVDELAGTRLVDATVHPSWWRLETDRLEAAVLRKGEAAIIPLLLHAEAPAQETISLNSAEVGCRPGQVLFSFDYRLPLPTGVDVFRPVPIQSEVIALTGFRATERPAGEYRHRLRLEPRRNAYHVLTQVPAWVASVGGRRACFLLPENLGVTLRGSLPTGADRYRVSVECGGKSAQILAHVPAAWPAADVRLNGRPTQAAPVDVAGRRCLRVDVPAGRSDIEVTRRPAPAPRAPAERYRGPLRDTWSETARRIFYTNLRPRAFSEEGRSCLALSSDSAGGGMANLPLVYGSEEAAGFAVTVKGANTGGRLVVELVAGDAWTHEIRDDFTGWRGFSVTREQMACKAATKKWAPVSAVRVYATPAAGKELTLANLRLLPARAQDRERKEVARKHLVATRAGAPPRLDGQPNDACWRAAPVATDFYGYSGNRISGSRTLVRACYDSENLYLFFDNLESIEDAGPLRERDAQIWSGDHVELYLDPNRGKGDWFQLLVDPAGTIQDVIYTATGRDFGWNGAFEVKTALNWKASWTAEFRVPFRILGRRPAMGDVWGINFARKDISGEFSNWAATREWLDPAGFGEVQFGGATAPVVGSAV